MTDQERAAITALRRGDSGGLEPLFDLYQLRAVRTAFLITGDLPTAEDVVADAFLTVYDRIGQFDDRRPFAPWFYRIVVNGALAIRRQDRRRAPRRGEDAYALDRQIDAAPGPEEEATRRELRQNLVAAIGALPPAQRAALVLHHYLEMDEASIAQALACPRGTVKWRLYAARRRLRRLLAEGAAPAPSLGAAKRYQ